MAPEQLEAKEADSRTDIFALGAIVYEMITGLRTFEGKSQASLIAAILDREPPAMSARQPLTPPSLERVVKKCLAKDPDARWQSASDLLDELKWIAESPIAGKTPVTTKAVPVSRIASIWAGVASVLLVMALAAVGWLYFRSPPEASEIRFEIAVPNISNPGYVTISPDGQWVAFTGSTATGTALFVRRSESTRPELLVGTDGATSPFWSPNSDYLAFHSVGRLKKISITGGQVQNICDAENLVGGTWNADDVIVFSSGGVLNRVPASGGEKVAISVRDDSKQETSHQTPFFLPDGKRYLYLAWSPQQANRAVYLGSLDSKDVTKILPGGSKAVYANSGHLLFQRNGTLFAQPFDADTATLTGDPVRLADEISYDALNGEAAFDVSKNGRLVYFAGGGPAVNRQFIWFDRMGRRIGDEGKPGLYTTNFDLSRDGAQIAVAQRNRDNAQYDIWLIDWVRGVPMRFTFDSALSPNGNVVWSPDGKRIAFASERTGNRDIFEKNVSGVGVETPLLATADDEWPEDFSADGRYLAYGRNVLQGTVGSGAIYVLELFDERKSITIADTPSNEDEPRFSPDGKWIAYNSNVSGTNQVYLVSFPAGDQKRQISTDGGAQPHWRRDGKAALLPGPRWPSHGSRHEHRLGGSSTAVQHATEHRPDPRSIRGDGRRTAFPRPVTGRRRRAHTHQCAHQLDPVAGQVDADRSATTSRTGGISPPSLPRCLVCRDRDG